MALSKNPKPTEKQNLHPRNLHRTQYDFRALIKSNPALSSFVSINKYGNESVDFADPVAVKELNRAILSHFYKIRFWDIPSGYLCPPVPGRADYIHYIADLLTRDGVVPIGKNIHGLDIGVGANCIYPIIGHQVYGWTFTGSDVDEKALQSAERIIQNNTDLISAVNCRLQKDVSKIFTGVVLPEDKFDFTMCNPPFHASLAEANAGTKRKWQNLGRDKESKKNALNFGGQQAELWYPGGEQAFILKMIAESALLKNQVLWFTSLVSKKTTLPALYQNLKKLQAAEVKTIEMSQGQKVSRMLAWSFLDTDARETWKQN